MKTTSLLLQHSMNRAPCRFALLIPLALACFALPPQARAICQDACLTNNNTVQGDDALISLTTGTNNTAIGYQTLFSNNTGTDNTGTGSVALALNTTGSFNTAIGSSALVANTTGSNNTATGADALQGNSTGNFNTAIGSSTLPLNYSGSENTASGVSALSGNLTGNGNTATGFQALWSNDGDGNTAIGRRALFHNVGNSNIALGSQAGQNLTTGNLNIDIGNAGVAGESKTIRIGTSGTQRATLIAGISGATVPTGVAVIVDSDGHLGTTTSSGRFKEAIKPMDMASEAILDLKPVTFRYKKDLDPKGIPQFGLIAEQVGKVNPDLVACDDKGKPYTVRYEAVNAMLLNEFLKEHRRVEQLEKQVEALTAGLQKVSAQLELRKSAPQTVSNDH